MKRKKQAAHVSHERWLVSYADFITLLFAFFVVMFATSQSDKNKVKEVGKSVRDALENGQFKAVMAGILGRSGKTGPGIVEQKPAPGKVPGFEPADLQSSLETLSHELKPELESGKMQIVLQRRGLVISLREAAFFPSGTDMIDPVTYPIIEKLATVIRKVPNPVRLEGHTDSVPIHNSRFHSNWELSAARSIAMLELLTQRFAVPEARTAVGGYADTAPVDSNDTAEGRAHNRRVDIVMLNGPGVQTTEPCAAGPPPTKERAHAGI